MNRPEIFCSFCRHSSRSRARNNQSNDCDFYSACDLNSGILGLIYIYTGFKENGHFSKWNKRKTEHSLIFLRAVQRILSGIVKKRHQLLSRSGNLGGNW